MKYAVLLDAAFVKRNLGALERPVTAGDITSFVDKIRSRHELVDFRLHRIYYYDAEPFALTKIKPLTGGMANVERVNFASIGLSKHNTALLDSLKREPFFALRLGETVFRGWSVKPQKLDPKKTVRRIEISEQDLVPTINQKGVDMRIGLDIASLSLKKQVDAIVLVAADSDFIPALKFARKEGVQVFVVSLGRTVKHSVHEHADVLIADGITKL